MRRFSQQNAKIPVLTYHNVQNPLPPSDPFDYAYTTTPEHFEENITTLLKYGFKPISLRQLYSAVVYNSPLPRRPVVITFDDGLEGVYTWAYPIMKKWRVRGASFMITDWPGQTVEGAKYFSWDAAKEMHKSGLMEIGSHSTKHLDYSKMTEAEVKSDIQASFATLEKHLGELPLKVFAYPFGLYNEDAINVLINEEVEMQMTGLGVTDLKTISLANIPRISVANSTTGKEIIEKINL